MDRQTFDILHYLAGHGYSSQRTLARETGVSLGKVNAVIAELISSGLMTAKYALTSAGHEALEPYRVSNAIILAAGMSSRFVPFSYVKPKGLLQVKGEILIERQIRQLREAGINDIYVVVGYKKELFFYLEEKFGVTIVINEDYATKNNISSIHAARHYLDNSYICSSDNYFTINPFASHVYDSYYSAVHVAGTTDEWCISTRGKDRLITGVDIGGCDAMVMLGHVYWSRRFTERYLKLLARHYNDPKIASAYWEDLYIRHIDQLPMFMKPYSDGIIREFDSLDDLRSFDPDFINNVDLDIFDNITHTLGCERSAIRNIEPLKQGLTNLSFTFTVDEQRYVYRHPGIGTELLINRNDEAAAQQLAAQLGLDDTYIYQHPTEGWKISRFIEDSRHLDPKRDEELREAISMMHKLHNSGLVLDNEFDFFETAQNYESHLLQHGPIDIREYADLADEMAMLATFVKADRADRVVCHNDFYNLNLLVDTSGNVSLIDWEYAGMGDPSNDLGTFCVCCMLTEDEVDHAIALFCGGTPSPEEYRHHLAHLALAGWTWYLWSLLKEAEGDIVGEWMYTYYRYAKTYVRKALALYKGDQG